MADPKNRTLSQKELELLSNIFRVMLKEITSDTDKENLAPGEMGIDYKNGVLWVRNPHNGKLFAPNSLEDMKLLQSKFDPGTTIFNADKVSGIRVYRSVIELDKLHVNLTPDSLIRQMHAPAIFCGVIEYSNAVDLGWPSGNGMCIAHKINEECVLINFYDVRSYMSYEGRYNMHKHLFEGWRVNTSTGDAYAETIGGGETTVIHTDVPLSDLSVVTVRISEGLEPGATVSINGEDPLPIYKQDGTPLDFPIAADNTIMLMFDESLEKLVLIESTESADTAANKILQDRIDDLRVYAVTEFDKLRHETTQAISELRLETSENLTATRQELLNEISNTKNTLLEAISDLKGEINTKFDEMTNWIKTRPGNIQPLVVNYTASSDNITTIAEIDGFVGSVDKLVVNYGQTILKPGIDYEVVENGITFLNGIELMTGDLVQFIVLKQEG